MTLLSDRAPDSSLPAFQENILSIMAVRHAELYVLDPESDLEFEVHAAQVPRRLQQDVAVWQITC